MNHILVVDDEREIADVIELYLKNDQYEVLKFYTGEEALACIESTKIDLALLDVMLPGMNGFSLCETIRRTDQKIGIIILSAKGQEQDKIRGLSIGADDYMTKPFSMTELTARIRAVLRRRAPEQVQEVVSVGELVLDAAAHRVSWQGELLKVGPTEFKLLNYLMKHPERVHSRAQLLDKVWGDHVFIEERTVDVHVKRLREALGAASPLIETVRGAGYRFSAQAAV